MRTVPFIAGLVVGDLALFVPAVLGLAALASAMGPFFAIVKWRGFAYLPYLAYQLWHRDPVSVPKEAAGGEGLKLLMFGTLLPLGNPKAIGFYIALLPAVLDVTTLTTACLQLALVIILVWSMVLAAYTGTAAQAGRLFSLAYSPTQVCGRPF